MSRLTAKAVADVTGGTILAIVEIKAAAERIFQALTNPAEVPVWWGSPEVYQTKEWSADLRVGGKWRGSGIGRDGNAFHVEGEFVEISIPHKLRMTWRPSWEGGEATMITYRLEPVSGGTRLTVRHEGFVGREASCREHAEGWEYVLSWLDGYVSIGDRVWIEPEAKGIQDEGSF